MFYDFFALKAKLRITTIYGILTKKLSKKSLLLQIKKGCLKKQEKNLVFAFICKKIPRKTKFTL
jgi:hypothetical protein